jgi:Glutamine amidotransferase class-I
VLGPDGARTIDGDEAVRWETDFGVAELSHINLYDRTVEGLRLVDVPGATVQYHPEAGPGPHDALYLFDRFLSEIASSSGDTPEFGANPKNVDEIDSGNVLVRGEQKPRPSGAVANPLETGASASESGRGGGSDKRDGRGVDEDQR